MDDTNNTEEQSTYCKTTEQLHSFFKDLVKVQMLDAANSELLKQGEKDAREHE